MDPPGFLGRAVPGSGRTNRRRGAGSLGAGRAGDKQIGGDIPLRVVASLTFVQIYRVGSLR